jgi:endogenous inhibitor of DNA gyrase (YacG/DUF329 family)
MNDEATIPCPSCGGSGRWNIRQVDNDGNATGERHIWPCPICGSKGKITPEVAEQIRKAVDS